MFQTTWKTSYNNHVIELENRPWRERLLVDGKEVARQKQLESRTVDLVNAGEEQNERDHNMKGENTEVRDFNERQFRFANTNGWF